MWFGHMPFRSAATSLSLLSTHIRGFMFECYYASFKYIILDRLGIGKLRVMWGEGPYEI